MPKPSARRATAWPMRPGADDRERRAVKLEPEPARRLPRAPRAVVDVARGLGSRRAAASISANARSAVASVRTPGVTPTGMPRRAASARSMLSEPTA